MARTARITIIEFDPAAPGAIEFAARITASEPPVEEALPAIDVPAALPYAEEQAWSPRLGLQLRLHGSRIAALIAIALLSLGAWKVSTNLAREAQSIVESEVVEQPSADTEPAEEQPSEPAEEPAPLSPIPVPAPPPPAFPVN